MIDMNYPTDPANVMPSEARDSRTPEWKRTYYALASGRDAWQRIADGFDRTRGERQAARHHAHVYQVSLDALWRDNSPVYNVPRSELSIRPVAR